MDLLTEHQSNEFELYIKDFLDPVIRTTIIELNELALIDTAKIVIAGGEALNYYFKTNEDIETHDFDLRIVDLKDPLGFDEKRFEYMLAVRENIATSLLKD